MYYYKEKDYWYFGALEKSVYKNLKLISSFKRNATNKEIYIKSDPAKDFLLKEFVSDNEIEEANPLSIVRPGCKAEIKPYKELLSRKDIELLIDNLPLLKKPRSYQMDYLYYAVNHGNHINGSSVGTGKAQPLDTLIWTPNGAKKMGDLKVGDKILGVNSDIQTVIGIFPQGEIDCYKVTFTDGTSTECSKDHLWTVHLEKGGERVLTIKEMEEKGLRRIPKKGFYGSGQHKSYGLWRFALPILEKPIEFNSRKVSIDPYTLGVLLGDGCFSNGSVTIANPEIDIINGIVLPKGMKKTFKKQISKAIEICLVTTEYYNPLKRALKFYGLLGKHSYEKFIPKEYLINDIQTRIEILRGLMDTDGTVSKHGAVSFEVTSLQLVKDVKFLATSLGCKCYNIRTKKSYIGKVRHRDCYRLSITIPKGLNVFKHCKQKIERSSLKERRYLTRKFFKKIEYVGKKQMQCISVSNENNLYLCDDFIPTHNTISTIFYAEMLDLFPCMVVCPASVKSGWLREWKETNPNRRVSIISTSSPPEDFEADVIVINYDILGKRVTKENGKTSLEIRLDGMKKKSFSLVIADEIHFLKNRKSIRSKSFKKLAYKVPSVIGLTGTLIMNRPAELLNILMLIERIKEIAPEDQYHHYFFERYCNMKETNFGMDMSGASNIKELNRLLKECCYFQVSKRDALKELPPISENVVECEITNKRAYKKAKGDLLQFIEDKFKDEEKVEKAARAEFLVKLSTLKQLSLEGKEKFIKKWVEEWMEANEEEKLLVFASQSTILTKIAEEFKEGLLITGGTTTKKRDEILQKFFSQKESRVLFANIGCLGTGVDGLQKVCSNMAILELPPRPSDLVQVIGRLERSGQKNPVTIQYLLSPETIDQDLWEMLKGKKDVTDMLNKGFQDDTSLMILQKYKNER